MRSQSAVTPERSKTFSSDSAPAQKPAADRHADAQGAASEHGRGSACYVLSIVRENDDVEASARRDEIEALVRAQGDRVVGVESIALVRPDPRTLIRSGVAARIADKARALAADMVVIDAELTPSQTRNLQRAIGLPICDREAVILNVFKRHASTRRAHVQVEIARLEYLKPRIRGIGLNMSQQMGGIKGGKGPGETASELMARHLESRLLQMRRTLEDLERSDKTRRKQRDDCERIALVGYTNAGKTSLMNALTSAGLSACDRPFETLDTTSRSLTRHGRTVLLSDSVGFIRRLPERLFASFASTLAEVREASLLALVLDACNPEIELHLQTTHEVLDKLEIRRTPRLIVFNKIDRLEAGFDERRFARLAGDTPFIAVSSHDEESVERLRERLLALARSELITKELFIPYARQELMTLIYGRCRVLRTRASPNGTQLLVQAEAHAVQQVAHALRRRA